MLSSKIFPTVIICGLIATHTPAGGANLAESTTSGFKKVSHSQAKRWLRSCYRNPQSCDGDQVEYLTDSFTDGTWTLRANEVTSEELKDLYEVFPQRIRTLRRNQSKR